MKLSYSQLSTYQHCPTKYKYSYVDRIKKLEEGKESHDLQWGSAIHEGLESYYSKDPHDLAEAKSSFERVYPLHLQEQDLAKTPKTGLECLTLYHNYYKEQDKNWRVIGAEVRDEFEFSGITWEVHIDLIAENQQGGGIYFWDHKTTSRAPNFTYWNQYELNSQLTAYSYYIQLKYGQCSGALINNMTVGHRKRVYKGEPAGFWVKFERQLFNRNQKQMDYWKKNVEAWKARIEWAKSNDTWGLHEGKLCGWCTYRELCLSCNDEQIRELLYTTKSKEDR